MSKNKFDSAANGFRKKLTESSPLEAPVRGFDRYSRDMSPATRELVLRARMPEIMAFAEDRRIDPAVVAGCVEASMRIGRIPDLGLYGLAGDEALAVKDFIASSMMGLEHELRKGLPQIHEDAGKMAQHKSYSDHYRGLADHHTRMIEFHTQAAKKANSEGKPFSAARHQAEIVMLKTLHQSHASLADYHGCETERCAKDAAKAAGGGQQQPQQGAGQQKVDQPTGQPQQAAHPAHGTTAAQRKEVPQAQGHRQEQTSSASVGQILKPIGSAFLRREPLKTVATKWEADSKEGKRQARLEATSSEHGMFKKTPLMSDFLAEEKKEKKAKKDVPSKKELGIKADPDKIDGTMANVKMAGLFQQLGHKMDHAQAQLENKKVKDTWGKKLHKVCLSKGGPAAFHEVVEASLREPWIRDQGFVDEASNLKNLWQTMMSAEADTGVSKKSPTAPEPLVFSVNRIIDMATGRGSIY
jgi:hypothetical protein